MPNFYDYTWSPQDHALLACTFPIHLQVGNTAMPTAGRMEFTRIRVPQAGMCANIVFSVGTGQSLTAGQNFAALYVAGGTSNILVAQSADQTANWSASGIKLAALAGGPYFLHASDYYVGVWFNGATGPSFHRGANSPATALNLGRSAPNLLLGIADTGLTTAAPATMGTQTSTTTAAWWVGLS